MRQICDGREGIERALLTVLVTNGSVLAAVQGGKELYYSTYKRRCSDRDHCPSLAPQCEHPTTSGFVNHLIVSSEPLQGENTWLEMNEGDIIGVDWRMRLVDQHGQNPPNGHVSLPGAVLRALGLVPGALGDLLGRRGRSGSCAPCSAQPWRRG